VKKALTTLLAVAVFSLPINALAVVKAGATCTKLGATSTYAGKKYTCIKSAKKLVWNKGVVVSKPTPTISPTPTLTPQPSPTPTQIKVPKEGDKCSQLGQQYSLTSSYLECRYVKGKQLIWILLNTKLAKFENPTSAQDVLKCKLQGTNLGNALTGFGIDITKDGYGGNSSPKISPAIGINDAIIVPIDFSDLPGDSNLSEIIQFNRSKYLSWIDYFSDGKLKVNLDFIDHWVRLPNSASYYNQTNYDLTQGQKDIQRVAQLYVDEITKEIDLRKYRTIYVIYPSNQNVIFTDLVPRSVEFKLKEGTRTMSLFADPAGYDRIMQTPPWVFWLHEIGHDWGLLGHAPGNGWPVGLMTNQAGLSVSLNAWERFMLTWMPDELVYCDTSKTLQTATIRLSALERADRQTKMIAVALDDHRLLIVEAHGLGEWTSRRPTQNYSFEKSGYYALMAYIVDTKFSYAGPTQVNADGSALAIDDGNNPVISRYAYFSQVDGAVGSASYNLVNFGPSAKKDYDSYWAVQGDTFTIEGVKITFVSTGDYETVKIEKAQN